MAERFVPPPKQPRDRRASPKTVQKLVEAAKAAGLDVTGFKALPDGSVEIFAGTRSAGGLFDELEAKGQL